MRKDIISPLAGAAPSLQPTAHPLSIPVGATPPAQRSPLAELANAFAGFNEELRAGLRDAAIREENDAYSAGELEATKQKASARMGEIETVLKQAVDAHQIPAVRAPAFERGFRTRAGQELADVFQAQLTGQLQDAMRADSGGPNKARQIVSDTYAKVSAQIHPDDLYARLAFDRASQAATARFLQQADAGYAAAYEAAGKGKMADQVSETAFQLATASDMDKPGVHAAFRAQVDQIRKELPVDEVNPFIVQSVVKPAVLKLMSEDKVPEAQALLAEMDSYDLTGQGGLLGKTEAAKAVFSQLRGSLDNAARDHDANALRKLQATDALDAYGASKAAGDALLKLRNANGGQLPPDARFQLIDQYRAQHPTDAIANQAFADAVHGEYDKEEKWRANERFISDLEISVQTLDRKRLDAAQEALDAHFKTGEIPASVRTKLQQEIERKRTLYGAIGEDDFRRMKLDLYAVKLASDQRTIDFGDANDSSPTGSLALWDGYNAKGIHVPPLPDALKVQHEQQATEFFDAALQDAIRLTTHGDPNLVVEKKQQALDIATTRTRAYARSLLRTLAKQAEADAAGQAVIQQEQAVRDARLMGGFLAPPQFNYQEQSTNKDGKPVTQPATYKLPKSNGSFVGMWPAEARAGLAEKDEVGVYFPPHSVLAWLQPGNAEGSEKIVNLPNLAKDILENPKPEAVAQAKSVYAYVKGLIGFTPEEVMKGVTKHGIPFDPTQIDPTRISVFRSREELEKAWNNGQPSELFLKVGDAIDSKNRITTEAFYKSQLVLLTHKL